MSQTANGTAGLIGRDHPAPKIGLVEALLHDAFGIATLGRIRPSEAEETNRLVEREQELTLLD